MARGMVVLAAVGIVALTACSGPQHSQASKTTPPPPTPTPSPTATPAAGGLLTLQDLPAGYVVRPLTDRNLPSNLTGCPVLERLMTGAFGKHEQVEFFRPPFGPWIDEALIEPQGETAARTADRLVQAIDGCSQVTVTEEGHRVTLQLTRSTSTSPQTTAAYRATGSLHGVALQMDVVVGHGGDRVVLLTNAGLASAVDPALTAQATTTALAKAGSP